MKIRTLGWRHKNLDQMSRIDSGFVLLGHELVNNNDYDFYIYDSSEYKNAIQIHEYTKILINHPNF